MPPSVPRVSRRTAIAALALPALHGLPARAAPPLSSAFTVIATDFVGGVNFIDGNVRPSINPSGRVAFVASQTKPSPAFQKAIFTGTGAVLSKIATEAVGYTDVSAVQVGAKGVVAFSAQRTAAASSWRGIYRANKLGVTTLIEGVLPYSFGNPPPAQRRLAMSTDGTTLGFATLLSGQGGIYRSAFTGAPTLLRQGSGVYYNNQAIAVTSGGAVTAQMEYVDPYGGLMRGLLVFDTPGDTLGTIESTIERQSVGFQPEAAVNGTGQMAFVTGSAATIPYYSAPLGGGVPTTSLTIPAGVHVATPTAFGSSFTFTTIATPADGYSNFGRVAINDSGVVVFEANAGAGRNGIFRGRDPIADKIVVTGENVTLAGQSHFFSIVRLGGINNAGQVAFQTSDYRSTDQQVWRCQL